MVCSNCGKKLNDGAIFCTNCGTKVVATEENTIMSENKSILKNKTVTKNIPVKKKKSISVLLIILLLIVLYFVFDFLQGKELPFGVTVPELPIPSIRNFSFKLGKDTNNNKDEVVYYLKNNGLYLLNGKENQEPITKTVSSDLYYDEKTGYSYFIKDYSIYKTKNGETELVARGENNNQCTGINLFFDGIVYNYDNKLYLYKNDEKTRICDKGIEGPGYGAGVAFDYENNLIYVRDENNKLYKFDEKLEKELVSESVDTLSYVAGIGLIYVTKDEPKTYVYKNSEKQKIYDGKLLVSSSNVNKGFAYLYENISLSKNANGYISNNSNNAFLEQVMQTAKNIDINRKFKNLFNYYIYDGNELNLLVSNVVHRGTSNEYLVVGKSFVKDSSPIELSTIGLDSSNYPDKLINAINDKFFPTNNLMYYVFKGSEASRIKFDDKEYLPYNISKTSFVKTIKDNNLKIQIYNENNDRDVYEGKLNFNNITNLKLKDNLNSNMSTSEIFVQEAIDDNSYNLYDNKGTKLLFENVIDYYYDGSKYLYAITNYDTSEGAGTLYRKDLDSGDKEKISNGVIGFHYRFTKPTIKTIQNVKTSNFNFDSLGGDKVIDEYIKANLMTGWVNDKKNNNIWNYYKPNHQKAINEYLELEGKWYHFDENGNMDTNKWIGDFYYGEDGAMKTNEWVGEYYVGKDGKFKTNSWVGNFYVGSNGKKVYNQWVYPYYVGSDGKYVVNTVIDGKNIGVDGKVIIIVETTQARIIETTQQQTTSTNTNQNVIAPTEASDANKELSISGYLTTYKDTFAIENDYDSTISIRLPKVTGKDQVEAEIINDFINESILNELAGLLEERLNEVSPAYKSIQITKAEITTIQKRTIRITLSGTGKKKNGNSVTMKYRMTYDREEETYELTKIS